MKYPAKSSIRSLLQIPTPLVLALCLAACGGSGSESDGISPGGGDPGGGDPDGGDPDGGGPGPVAGDTPYPILFVTQVPLLGDFLSVVSTFGNHQGFIGRAPRGGDLYIRYPNGELRNLTREAGFGMDGLQVGEDQIAVREPSVHWSGTRAVFSMVVGGPKKLGDWSDDDFWQLYEVTGLAPGDTATITKVSRQPEGYNNVAPCYASDGRILFASDRPRNGAAHLYPQLDEYEEQPTVTGLWSLNADTGDLFLLNHSPSGVFSPTVDSFGRVIFTRWDHLERDQQKDLELIGGEAYDTFNWSSEAVDSYKTLSNAEVFPEPRKAWIYFINTNPDYDGPLEGWEPHLVGMGFNRFTPWMIHQDGTGEETLNHVGRHELFSSFERSRKDDPNVESHYFSGYVSNNIANRNFIRNVFHLKEDPTQPGSYYGTDAREFDTQSAGQIVRITGAPNLSPNEMRVNYITHRDTADPSTSASPEHTGLYRTPLPLSDGRVLVSHTPHTTKVQATNGGYRFQLKFLDRPQGQHARAGAGLTGGIQANVTWYSPGEQRTYNGRLWELDAVEVRSRPVPPAPTLAIEEPEARVLSAEGVSAEDLRGWLSAQNLALVVSRNVTSRDANDRQQPFNLRVPGGVESVSAPGVSYDVSHLQFFQGDQLRSLYRDSPKPGRRVLAQPMHDGLDHDTGGPEGSVTLAPDGSMAALVPARRALTWQLTDPIGDAVVRERFWLTFQPGEIRTCASCHGLNEEDQLGRDVPQNEPEALRKLLQYLKTEGHLE